LKLAELLLERADLQKKVSSLKDRMSRTAMVQEGDRPVEAPEQLHERLDSAIDALQAAIFRINQANLTNELEDGRTIIEALAERDALVQKHGAINTTIEAATRPPDRYSSREILWVATVDVPALQDQMDRLGDQIRKLNIAIQAANWRIELT
jgi:hypothetical protein